MIPDDICLFFSHRRVRKIVPRLLNQARKISHKHYRKEKRLTEVKLLTLTKLCTNKLIIDSSLLFPNDAHHAKLNSISDEEGK